MKAVSVATFPTTAHWLIVMYKLSPLIPRAIVCISMAAGMQLHAAETTASDLAAAIQFDKQLVVDNGPITGVVEITSAKSAETKGFEISLIDDGALMLTVTDVAWGQPLPDRLEAGKAYRLPFRIDMAGDLMKLKSKMRVEIGPVKIFSQGSHTLRAVVRSGKQDESSQLAASEPATLTVHSGYSGALTHDRPLCKPRRSLPI
jgi:hypothetical protein